MKRCLPGLFGRWAGFVGEERITPATEEWPYVGKQTDEVRRFLDLLHKSNKPTVYFLHLLMPHLPFSYNEHGQRHRHQVSVRGNIRKVDGGHNYPSEQMAILAQQAHLIQLVFVDRILGMILDKLEEIEILEDALVVVTSDHGSSYYWNDEISGDERLIIQASDTMYVPLFIKAPNQDAGVISDRFMQIVDIVPTIADMLDVQINWQVDGISALTSNQKPRKRIASLPKRMEFDSVVDPSYFSLHRRIELFGTRTIDGLYSCGPQSELLGTETTALPSTDSPVEAVVSNRGMLRRVDAAGSQVPAYVKGQISGLPSGTRASDLILAVAMNGVIRSTARAMDKDGKITFLTRIPPSSYTEEMNQVSVHLVNLDKDGTPTSLTNLVEK